MPDRSQYTVTCHRKKTVHTGMCKKGTLSKHHTLDISFDNTVDSRQHLYLTINTKKRLCCLVEGDSCYDLLKG